MLVTPNYHFNGNCEEALKLYQKAFNGNLLMLIRYRDANPKDMCIEGLSDREKNYVYHAEMVIGTQRFMFNDSTDEIPKGQSISIVITFECSSDVKNAYNILIDDAKVIHPLQETTYSSCFASLIDKFGMRWELMTENKC
ncbi:VOC family protein [Oceanirhabdus sp. W0125-5]|uniref:VOC family protein n=1 Tax=Oceanirhabdus sp. W0125-5 TaxID=2999116 RepID=UPI0022F3444D|nr:VOC family protein [Oceanirhabdus sp. W0125-5]WBW99622.1 VOC family protein [Oceanirhabdus sp. W0125-5]